MESSVFAISPDALVRLLIFLLYAPVVLISYRSLIPRLSPTSKRLATVMLAAQVLVVVLSLLIQPTSEMERRFWSLDYEGHHLLHSCVHATGACQRCRFGNGMACSDATFLAPSLSSRYRSGFPISGTRRILRDA